MGEEGHRGNTGLPFGLCKKYGLWLPDDATPRDAWDALENIGLTPEQAYAEMSTAELKELLTSELGEKKKPTAYGFANKERKHTKHHQRHAREMGYKNQDEYECAAVDFFNGNQGKLYYSERRERFYRYDENTKKVAVCDSEGIIHTFDFRTQKEFEKMVRQDMLNET